MLTTAKPTEAPKTSRSKPMEVSDALTPTQVALLREHILRQSDEESLVPEYELDSLKSRPYQFNLEKELSTRRHRGYNRGFFSPNSQVQFLRPVESEYSPYVLREARRQPFTEDDFAAYLERPKASRRQFFPNQLGGDSEYPEEVMFPDSRGRGSNRRYPSKLSRSRYSSIREEEEEEDVGVPEEGPPRRMMEVGRRRTFRRKARPLNEHTSKSFISNHLLGLCQLGLSTLTRKG